MSNFKRFLALALACMMVVGMMVFTAPAASAYEATGDYKESITLLNKFDVMLGNGDNFDEKGEVTRWQMALFIARIVTGFTGNEMWEAAKSERFTDVTADNYPGAIDFCAEMGYIVGVGDNKFEPNAPITYRDALTMLVRVCGKETKSTTYPWGYILTARTISNTKGETLTEDVNASYTANLRREQVADLLAKVLYVYSANLGGTFVEKSLKCEDKGVLELTATETFAINGNTLAAAGKLTIGGYTVLVKNATKASDLDWCYYLGAKAAVYTVKGVYYADFGGATVSNGTLDANAKVGGKALTNAVNYGADEKNFYVANTAKSVDARIITVENGKTLVIPFNELWNIVTLSVTFGNTSNAASWQNVKSGKLYYFADTAELKVGQVLTAIGVGNGGLQGQYMAGGKVSVSSGNNKDVRQNIADASYIKSTDLRVKVDGNLVSGVPFYGNVARVGAYTFVTVGSAPEIVSGTAVLSAILDEQIKLGDTNFSIGYTGIDVAYNYNTKDKIVEAVSAKKANSWYGSFADFNNDANLVKDCYGQSVDYKTVNGKIVSIALHKDNSSTTTPTKTYPNSYTKDAVALVLYTDGTGITVNADNTLTLQAADLTTGALTTVKVDQINGTNVAKLINDYGAKVAANILGYTGATTVAEIVEELIGTTAEATNDGIQITEKKTGKIVLTAVANKTDDVVSLSSDTNGLKQIFIGKSASNSKKDNTIDFTFKKYADAALSTAKYATHAYDAAKSTSKEFYADAAEKYLTVTANTKIIVLGLDGMKILSEVPEDGQHLLLDTNTQYVFALSNDLIVVVDFSRNVADITDIKASVPVAPKPVVKADWYTLTWTTKYVGCEVVVENKIPYFNYTFENMYNMSTKKLETVVISLTDYIATNVSETIFGNRWTAGKVVPCASNAEMKALITAKAAFYQPYYISEKLGSAGSSTALTIESSMISWGLANKYKVGVVNAASYADINTLKITNLKVTEKNGKYELAKNAGADDVSLVVNYSLFVYNIFTGAVKDEIGLVNVTAASDNIIGGVIGGNSGYHGNMVGNAIYNSTTEGKKEVVLYKFDEKTGIAEVICNFGDGLGGSNFATVNDVCAVATPD